MALSFIGEFLFVDLERYARAYTGLADIGSNLGDPVFRGSYRGKQHHEDDVTDVLSRAQAAGVRGQILTGGDLPGSRSVHQLAQSLPGFYSTAGCHPCHASQMGEVDAYIASLDNLITEDRSTSKRIVAVGECGLDYDRLSLCDKETQLRHFPPQLHLATKHHLPLFLHSRTSEAHVDFVSILTKHDREFGLPKKGVVHSFTGTLEEMNELIQMGYFIGVNGCSLKTEDNIKVVKEIPLDKIMLETVFVLPPKDCPYCDIRPTHASHQYLVNLPSNSPFNPPSVKKERHKVGDGKVVKSRNEPCTIGQVAWVVSQIKGVSAEELSKVAWNNTVQLFQLTDL